MKKKTILTISSSVVKLTRDQANTIKGGQDGDPPRILTGHYEDPPPG